MLKQAIRPEFLNRIDEIVLFKPLTPGEIRTIVGLQIRHVKHMVANKNITLECTDDVISWLATLGYDPSFGARPLKRVIQKYVVNVLSEKMLSGEIVEGDTVEVRLDKRGMVEFLVRAKAEVVS